ncbi:MAG: branched-chain amino acid ABC transporter permease [Armatimonadota bacterium]|nr:branched-chain amino acid ABC transporter permease [Armatimonadota bacterium]MDW8156326.1 branched-chain amino acid ABC transporter permease [Armatimonadota bacterium]
MKSVSRLGWAGLVGVLVLAGWLLPRWLVFLLALALAKGVAVLSVVVLMRAGLVSFGQGLFFAAAAYAAGFAMRWGVRETLLLVPWSVGVAVLVGALAGLLVARYRDIFFAMLTLALSMVLYGILIKAYGVTGGSDGIRIPTPTLLGVQFSGEGARLVVYYLAVAATVVAAWTMGRYDRSPAGYLAQAVRDNELRVAYLGAPVPRVVYLGFLLSSGLAGLGGVLTALNVGHVDPGLSYWTTSGELVFIAVLGGTGSVMGPLAGAVVYELIRSYAFKYAPYAWQMMLGAAMLLIILFLPGGLWSPVERLWRRQTT